MTAPPVKSRPHSARELTHEALSELLLVLESARRSVVINVSTDHGPARLWTRSGKVIDAEYGVLRGRPALMRILNLSRGSFSLRSNTSHPAAFSEAPSELLEAQARRTALWRQLVEHGPSLDAVLSFRREHQLDGALDDELKLLRLFDGRRLLVEAIDESGLDAVAALQAVHQFVEKGALEIVSDDAPPTLNQFPMAEVGEKSGLLTNGAAANLDDGDGEPEGVEHWRSESPSEPDIDSRVLAIYETVSIAPEALDDDPPRLRTLMGLPKTTNPPPSVAGRITPVAQRVLSENPPPVAPNTAAPAPTPVLTREISTPQAPTTTPQTPVRLGRYEVLCCIKRGGMGAVYLCRVSGDAGFRRLFALKAVRQDLADAGNINELFYHEARLSALLHHPNVVNIVDFGSYDDQPYLVMDYVEGCGFDELLRSHQTHRPPRLIVPIVLDLLNGLHAAHMLKDDHGQPLDLVHCDVTPHNMLVGVDGACRVTDFGVAVSRERRGDGSPTRGKPGFLSPEQITGKRIDHRSDIFSVGTVLYNALTGTRLFAADSPEKTLHNVLHQRIVPPSKVGLEPPAVFDDICMRALARDPARRFQSAEEMLIALRDAAAAHSMLAPPSEVAAWVYSTVGEELQVRRLASLDAARTGGVAQTSNHQERQPAQRPPPAEKDAAPKVRAFEVPKHVAEVEADPRPAMTPKKSPLARFDPTDFDVSDLSRTVLYQVSWGTRWIYVALAVLALLIGGAVMFPDHVRAWFGGSAAQSEPGSDKAPSGQPADRSTGETPAVQ